MYSGAPVKGDGGVQAPAFHSVVTFFSMDLFNFLSGRKVSLCFALQGIFKKASGKPKSSNVIQKDKKDFGNFIFFK